MRKRCMMCIAAVILSMSIAGCEMGKTPMDKVDSKEDDRTVVVFKTWNPTDMGPDSPIHGIIADFEELYPHIDVQYEYGIGVLIDEDTMSFNVDEMKEAGYRIWDVKPGTYVVFECIGENGDCISDTWARFYKEFLPQLGYVTEEATDYEIYFEKGRKGLFCELWIPVRKK